MDSRKTVYLEDFVAAHNERLRTHPSYRGGMKFSPGFARGDLIQHSRDRPENGLFEEVSPEDLIVFEEVRRQVATTHTLIQP